MAPKRIRPKAASGAAEREIATPAIKTPPTTEVFGQAIDRNEIGSHHFHVPN